MWWCGGGGVVVVLWWWCCGGGVGGVGGVADTNYLYPARWSWVNKIYNLPNQESNAEIRSIVLDLFKNKLCFFWYIIKIISKMDKAIYKYLQTVQNIIRIEYIFFKLNLNHINKAKN